MDKKEIMNGWLPPEIIDDWLRWQQFDHFHKNADLHQRILDYLRVCNASERYPVTGVTIATMGSVWHSRSAVYRDLAEMENLGYVKHHPKRDRGYFLTRLWLKKP